MKCTIPVLPRRAPPPSRPSSLPVWKLRGFSISCAYGKKEEGKEESRILSPPKEPQRTPPPPNLHVPHSARLNGAPALRSFRRLWQGGFQLYSPRGLPRNRVQRPSSRPQACDSRWGGGLHCRRSGRSFLTLRPLCPFSLVSCQTRDSGIRLEPALPALTISGPISRILALSVAGVQNLSRARRAPSQAGSALPADRALPQLVSPPAAQLGTPHGPLAAPCR